MALSGYFYGTTDNPRVKPKIEWSAVQSIEGNYTDITATLSYSRTNTGYTTSGTWEGKITIGEQMFTGKQYVKVEHESNTVAISATARVYHDAYGNLTVPISAVGGIDGSSVTKTIINGQAELDTILRASAVSASNAAIGSRATIVVVRKNEGFTHSLSYRFRNLEGFIDPEGNATDREVKITMAAVNFLLPESFYYRIPNLRSDYCYITCRTYFGETLIGTEECRFIASADPDLCAPEVTEFTVSDDNEATATLTGDSNVLVRYGSNACCRVAAAARFGAQIVSMTVNGVEMENGVVIFQQATEENYELTVTDSRGYQKKIPKPAQLIPYVELTCVADAQRPDPTADSALITIKGNCWKGNFGAAENGLTVTCSVAGGTPQTLTPQLLEDHTYATQLTVSGVSYTKSYAVDLTVSDGVSTVTKSLTIRKGVPVFDWGENDFKFNVPVEVQSLTVQDITIQGTSLSDYIRAIIEGG